MKNTLKSEKMGKMPMGKLLAVMSLPAMLSMFVQALYNIVDSIYVSALGTDAITALSIAFPVQIFLLAFAIGIGVGTNSLVSRRLGEGKNTEASRTVQNGLVLSASAALIFSLGGLFFSRHFIALFTDSAAVIEMGTSYLTIVTVFSAGFFLEILLTKTLQATGNMIIPMIAQLIGAVTNIVLDPVLIFGYLGFPAMGVSGAAIATVTGQFFSLAFTVTMFRVKKHEVHLNMKGFKPRGDIIGKILYVGIPTIVLNSVSSFTLIIFNGILKKISLFGIPVLGIYFKLQSFIFMPIFGLAQGAMPIMGYNYGAGNKERFNRAFRLTLTTALIIMIAGTAIFQLLPSVLLSFFNAEQGLYAEGIPALKLISLCFLPAAFGIITTTMFQSVGHGLKSLFMTLTRQVGVLIPAAIIMSDFLGAKGIWISYPLAEIVTALIFFPIAVFTMRGLFKQPQQVSELSLENAK